MDRTAFENCTAGKRFSICTATRHALAWIKAGPETERAFNEIVAVVGNRQAEELIQRLVRNIFFIEAVNQNITSTKFTYRWLADGDQFFDFSLRDSRGNSFEKCLEIFVGLLSDLAVSMRDDKKLEIITAFLKNGLVSYELPLDYVETDPGDGGGYKIHEPNNIEWVWTESSAKVIGLRSAIGSLPDKYDYRHRNIDKSFSPKTVAISDILLKVLKGKIEVKTYKTDRAQTGNFQTNREKRWEAHPNSVQFSSRRTAWGIEFALLEQIIYFQNFPQEVRARLIAERVISEKDEITRCPITLDALSFPDFVTEIMSPIHGRSDYQVGHLNPLKAVGRRDNPEAGHTAANISWISQDGNRIQGPLSLHETQTLLRRVWNNYQRKNHPGVI